MNEFYKRLISSLILIPCLLIIIVQGSIIFNIFLILCFLISLIEWYKISFKKIFFIFGSLYLIFSFFTAYLVRSSLFDNGLLIFLLLILISVSTDLGGYLFGKIFKGPKLTKISPNKTYAGMFGGFLLSIIFSYLYLKKFEIINTEHYLNIIKSVALIFLLSFISQIGDLTISYFKRKSKQENTGNLIPGHGGILDRIDGIIFVIPFFYLLNLFIKFQW